MTARAYQYRVLTADGQWVGPLSWSEADKYMRKWEGQRVERREVGPWELDAAIPVQPDRVTN